MNPSRYTDSKSFDEKRNAINEALSYVGYELQANGRFREITVANTINEAQIRANNLIAALNSRNAHHEILKYCKAGKRPIFDVPPIFWENV